MGLRWRLGIVGGKFPFPSVGLFARRSAVPCFSDTVYEFAR